MKIFYLNNFQNISSVPKHDLRHVFRHDIKLSRNVKAFILCLLLSKFDFICHSMTCMHIYTAYVWLRCHVEDEKNEMPHLAIKNLSNNKYDQTSPFNIETYVKCNPNVWQHYSSKVINKYWAKITIQFFTDTMRFNIVKNIFFEMVAFLK